MKESVPDAQRLIAGLRDGDRAVFAEFMARYRPALERVAARRIDPAIVSRVSAESVVQSVCRTFLRRSEGGAYELTDGDALWRLLCAMTLHKVIDRRRFHKRLKRSVDRERALPDQGLTSPGRPPEELLAFEEVLEKELESLSGEERLVFDLRLRGRTQAEIAEELGSSERTVRRVLGRLETRMRTALRSE